MFITKPKEDDEYANLNTTLLHGEWNQEFTEWIFQSEYIEV